MPAGIADNAARKLLSQNIGKGNAAAYEFLALKANWR
jgi:hypothetical protein